MVKDTSVDTIDMFEDMDEQDIIADKWYLVSTQGVESGPYDTYRRAADASDDVYTPMYGEQVLDMLDDDETDWFAGEDPTLGGW